MVCRCGQPDQVVEKTLVRFGLWVSAGVSVLKLSYVLICLLIVICFVIKIGGSGGMAVTCSGLTAYTFGFFIV